MFAISQPFGDSGVLWLLIENGEGMIDIAHTARKSFFALSRLTGMHHFAPASLSGVGGILMLHRVSTQPRSPLGVNDHLSVTPYFLEKTIIALKRDGYEFIAMDNVPQAIGTERAKRFIAVTFDDGYLDNYQNAYPILRKHNIPYTVYIAPGLINGDVHLWWEIIEQVVAIRSDIVLPSRHGREHFECNTKAEKLATLRALQNNIVHKMPEEQQATFIRDLAQLAGIDCVAHNSAELMNWNQVREIAKDPLCTIGAHTYSHFHLKKLSDDTIWKEIEQCQIALDLETGMLPKHLAYPYGYAAAIGSREVAIAGAAGYKTGVTTRHGMLFSKHEYSPMALPRISLNGRHQNVSDVRTMLAGLTGLLANGRKNVVTV